MLEKEEALQTAGVWGVGEKKVMRSAMAYL